MSGVNLELSPLVRLTFPAQFLILDPSSAELRKRLFRSWILLFGLLPIEIYDVTLLEFEPGHRFLERSPMFSQMWQHERILEASEKGCLVTDRVTIWPRLTWLLPLSAWVVRVVFKNRHRNLRRLF